MGSQDILSAIDDAVSSRCACGCGTHLDPAGASMWFASPDCQWRYQQQHADDPGDVYDRPDATVGIYAELANEEALRRRLGGRAFREAFGAPGERIPYQFLNGDEREALHAWVELHDVDHTRVPVEARIELDEATNEWLIPVHSQRDGRAYLDENGDVATEVVRRPNRADLPWPRVQPERQEIVPSAQSPVFEFTDGTRLWINNEEVTEHVTSIRLDPVIEDTSFADSNWREMLNGLQSGSITIGGNWDWMAVNPTAPTSGHIATWDETHEWDVPTTGWVADWVAEHMPERPLTDFQRLVLNGAVASVPEPPSPGEVMDNVRRYMRLISDQPTFVGNEETVERVSLFGHDMDIVTSPLVPANTIIAIDNAALNRAREEAFRTCRSSRASMRTASATACRCGSAAGRTAARCCSTRRPRLSGSRSVTTTRR